MTDHSNTGNALHHSQNQDNGDVENDQGVSNTVPLDVLIEQYRAKAHAAKSSSESWLEHCKELVFEYRRLLQSTKSNYYKKDGEIGYLLSNKWLEEWKKVHYYDSYYRNLKPDFDEGRPVEIGPISNNELIMDRSEFYNDVDPNSYYNFMLKPNIKMNVDYKPVEEEIWRFFVEKYGGVEIKRFYYKTYSFGADIEAKLKEYKVVILPNCDEWDIGKITNPKSIFTSKHDKFSTLFERLENILNKNYGYNLTQDRMRPWKLAYNTDIKKIDNEVKNAIAKAPNDDMAVDNEENKGDDSKVQKSLGVKFPGISLEMMMKFDVDDIELSSNDILVIETASAQTKRFIFHYEKIEILGYGKCEYCYSHKPLVVECRCKEVQYCSDECMKKDERFHVDKCNAPIEFDNESPFEKKARARNGLTGLQNLGNTCFMNSSIQCLSNNFVLTQYFLNEIYKNELNTDNVLGTGGKLAVQFARLLNELWNEEAPVVTPWSFKKVVGNFQPMFSGFAQHDSAELLSFVLDGLHEDLNRVTKKPYYEMPNLKKSTSEEISAKLSWKYHLLRNQSIIVDLMHGQYKSTLCCPKCSNISVTYDPYMMLSLPIPMNEIETNVYYFLFYDSNKCPFKSKYYLKKSSSIIDLRKQIAEQIGVDPWSFILCQIDDNNMERMYCRNRTVADISEEEGILFAFQIDPTVFESQRNADSYKHLNKLSERSEIAVDMSNDDDFNNSISRDWVKVPLRLNMMAKSKYSYYERKKAISFPRVLWLNRNWDLITVHKTVFTFLRYFFDIELESFSQLSEEEAFTSLFDDLNEQTWQDKLGDGESPGDYCYALNIVNPEKKSFYSKGAKFFGYNNFNNIPLPYTQSKTIGELIDEYFLEYENKDDSSDDDESKKEKSKVKSKTVKNNTNDGFYQESEYKHKKNKVFEFEIFWNKDRLQANIEKLSRCKKHDKFTEISAAAEKTTSEDITLDQCFDSFSTTEMLGQDNAWYCRTCKDHVEAKKKMELYSTPPILFISLKRFKSGRGSYFKDKLEDKVHFPIDCLDISNIVISNKKADGTTKENLEYELFAISNHYGNMGFGHYTAYCKNPKDQSWYDFDDSHVSQVVHKEKVITEAAYNLFYRRKDFKWDEDLDFEKIKQTCDFEEFKLEVSHYSAEEEKTEVKMDLESAPSGGYDVQMEDQDVTNDEAIAKQMNEDQQMTDYANIPPYHDEEYNVDSDDKDD